MKLVTRIAVPLAFLVLAGIAPLSWALTSGDMIKQGVSLLREGKTAEALDLFSRAQRLDPNGYKPHYSIASALERLGEADSATVEYKTALRINPKFTSALITKSLAYSNLNLYSEAAETLERYLGESPEGNEADTWRGQLEELQRLIASDLNPCLPIFCAKDVTQKARVLCKPEPQYS